MGDCVCQIDVEHDGCSSGFYNKKIRNANKEHMCGECGDPIKKGDNYEYVSGMWEGYLDSFKTCIDCVSIREALFCSFCHDALFEDLSIELQESLAPVKEECLLQMTPKGRGKVLDLIDRIWEKEGVWDTCSEKK